MGLQLALIIRSVGEFYIWVIIIYILMSWLPDNDTVGEIRRVLGTVVEPYLGIFRRIIPPIGMIDVSAIVAVFALQIILSYVIVPLVAKL